MNVREYLQRENRIQFPEAAREAARRHHHKSGIPIRTVDKLPPARNLQVQPAGQEAREEYSLWAIPFRTPPTLPERDAPGDPAQVWWDPLPGAKGYTKV